MSQLLPRTKSISGFVLLASLLGCSASNYMETEYVEGLVTLDGTPIPGATVTFEPIEPGQGIAGVGVSDESGIYRLTAMGNRDGLKPEHGGGVFPGKYLVAVEKVEIAPEVQAKLDAGVSVPYSEAAIKRIIPKKFSDAAKSGLQVEVVPGNNDIPLQLGS